jgi:hypothetical protein
MAKFDYEIAKSLRNTGLTMGEVKTAIKSNDSTTLGKFMRELSFHVHGEGLRDAMKVVEAGSDGQHSAYCVVCGKGVMITNPLIVKIRNRKSRNGGVDAHKGNCPHCNSYVYKIIGH